NARLVALRIGYGILKPSNDFGRRFLAHFPLPKSPRVTRCHAATISALDRPNSLSNSGGTWQPERPGGTPRFDGQYPRPVLARVSTNSRRRARQSAASACGSGCGSSTALGERAASNFSPFCTQVSHAASMLANRLPFFRWCERKRSTSRSMRGSVHAARLAAYCRPRGPGSQSSGTNLFTALASAGGLLASGEALSLTPFRGFSFSWVWVPLVCPWLEDALAIRLRNVVSSLGSIIDC